MNIEIFNHFVLFLELGLQLVCKKDILFCFEIFLDIFCLLLKFFKLKMEIH